MEENEELESRRKESPEQMPEQNPLAESSQISEPELTVEPESSSGTESSTETESTPVIVDGENQAVVISREDKELSVTSVRDVVEQARGEVLEKEEDEE